MTATAQSRAATAATATAQPRRAPAHVAPKRPPLRVVQPGERTAADQRRRTRRWAVCTVLLVACGLFGLVVSHVLLTQNQFRLERLQRQAAAEQARFERLRLQVAELESPGRIVAAAQERLGMVSPPSVKYLTPAKTTPAPASSSAAADHTGKKSEAKKTGAPQAEQAITDWSAVKRQLGTRP